MAIAAVAWAFEQRLANPSAKLVLLALADHADGNGMCWPSLARLEQRTSLSRSSVIRALADLESRRLIVRTRRGQTSNCYHLPSVTVTLPGVTMTPPECHHDTSPSVTVTPKPSSETSPKRSMKLGARAMTDDWMPDADLWTWAHASFPMFTREDLTDATDRFRDHWISKAERRADWRASWRNWIRNEAKFAARARPATRLDRQRTANAERIDAAMARHGVSREEQTRGSHLRLVADRDSGH